MTQTTRRDALKALAAATGAATLSALPTRWSKPALRVGAVPAHAQSSCLGVTAELLSTTGTIDMSVEQGPLPTSEQGTFGIPGYIAFWECQADCLELVFFADASSTANWLLTVGSETIPINLDDDDLYFVLINLSTLEISDSPSLTPLGCTWSTV